MPDLIACFSCCLWPLEAYGRKSCPPCAAWQMQHMHQPDEGCEFPVGSVMLIGWLTIFNQTICSQLQGWMHWHHCPILPMLPDIVTIASWSCAEDMPAARRGRGKAQGRQFFGVTQWRHQTHQAPNLQAKPLTEVADDFLSSQVAS